MPTSSRPYRNQATKNSISQNSFIKPKDMVRNNKLEGERKDRIKRWITAFRRTPHRFISEYFGIKLYPFQTLMIWVLQRSNFAYICAARASSKTFVICVYALTMAVLYPGIQIVIASKTLKQGGLLLSDKLKYLRSTYPNVAREIETITTNSNSYEAIFHCGSTIKVVPSSESARGNRASMLIIEESRHVSKDILEQILKPFLFSRTPPYRLKPEYANDPLLKEEGNISFITSAGYTSEYWFENVKSCIRRMVDGDIGANFLAFDYLITIYHNIKTEEMIKNEMADNDPVSVQMEYLNIPSGSSGKSYFKPSLFPRNIKRAFYPQKPDNYNPKKNPYDTKKTNDEIRIISVDIATRSNRVNDNTIISCIKLTPLLGRGYERQLVYMESHKGANTLVQAKRIKEVFFDFDADYLVLDLQQAGISIFDALSQPITNDDRGITHPAMTVADDSFIEERLREELSNRTLGVNAIQVIYPILASQSLNSQIAVSFRISLQKKLWNFLIPDGDAEEFLIKTQKEFTDDSNDSYGFSFFMNPYIQTGLMIGETINLDMSLVNGLIKLTEKTGMHKDRYSSLSYANWVISHLDKSLMRETEETDDWSELMNITQIY